MNYAYNEDKMMDGIRASHRDAQRTKMELVKHVSAERSAQLQREGEVGKKVVKLVANGFLVSPEDILSRLQNSHLCHAREAACIVLRREYGYSLESVGRILNRHHTSIVHSERRAAIHYEEHKPFRALIESMCTPGRRLAKRDALGLPTA